MVHQRAATCSSGVDSLCARESLVEETERWCSARAEGIVDTTAARATLGFRPIFPTVYTAKDAGTS